MTRTVDRVAVDETVHGPFRRVSFLPLDPPDGAQVSVYRLGDTLIDTGSTRVTDAVLELVRRDPPKRILLTHQHEDHIGNVRPILDAIGRIPVHAPRALLDVIVALRKVPPYRARYWGDPHPVSAEDLVPYDPGDVFEDRGGALVAVHTPGHTPPHVAFVLETKEDVFALTGDLYASKPLDAFLEAAQDDAIRSYRLLARHGERLRMLPTHGRVRLHGAKVLSDGADWLERESEALVALASELGTREPVTVARARYGEDPMLRVSSGEMGSSVFVRSVLAPVRELPASPLPISGCP
ncbi:MAG: MBL fold metallo-hydrolase [Polyangiales bacterium]